MVYARVGASSGSPGNKHGANQKKGDNPRGGQQNQEEPEISLSCAPTGFLSTAIRDDRKSERKGRTEHADCQCGWSDQTKEPVRQLGPNDITVDVCSRRKRTKSLGMNTSCRRSVLKVASTVKTTIDLGRATLRLEREVIHEVMVGRREVLSHLASQQRLATVLVRTRTETAREIPDRECEDDVGEGSHDD
jgi:hypothetical protein